MLVPDAPMTVVCTVTGAVSSLRSTGSTRCKVSCEHPLSFSSVTTDTPVSVATVVNGK
jgi:hypothetical protein